MKKPSLLILSFSQPDKDPHFYKELNYLKRSFDIVPAGFPPQFPIEKFIEIRKRPADIPRKLYYGISFLFGCSSPFLNSFSIDFEKLRKQKFDLILVNGLYPLPAAFRIAGNKPVFWNAYEYYPEEHGDSFVWRIVFRRNVNRILRRYVPRLTGMCSVSPSIVRRYHDEFGIDASLVRNVCSAEVLQPVMPGHHIRLIYHGDANPSRKIEEIIRMMSFLNDRFTLDLILLNHFSYQQKLKYLAMNDSRIRFLDPVPLKDLPKFLNRYDLGIVLIPPVNYNFETCLPNKFFECIQARLAVLAGPSEEMCRLVRRFGVGITMKNFSAESAAQELKSLSPEKIWKMKLRTENAARFFCAEREMRRFEHILLKTIKQEHKI